MTDSTSKVRQSAPLEGHNITPGEIIIGEVAGIDNVGRPLVIFSEMTKSDALVAMTTQEVTHKHVGRKVALLFANGETGQPVIVGLIHDPLADILENFSISESQTEKDSPFYDVQEERTLQTETTQDEEQQQVVVDGQRVTIQGAEEITLKCGKASITLTKSGKILLRGTYLSNRSSGVNRIMGGSVQIN